MKSAGLWLSTSRVRQFIAAQRTRGQDLERHFIVPLLASASREFQSGRTVGHSHLTSVRIPLVTAFGYEIGSALHSFLYGGHGERESVARMSALFNLGITLFDHVCDHPGSGFTKLTTVLDEPMLQRLLGSAAAHSQLKSIAAQPENSELRPLLATVSAFIRYAHDCALTWQATASWKHLTGLLLDAYRAELLTVSRQHETPLAEDLLRAAHRKSVLPFRIMLAIAQLCGDTADSTTASKVVTLVRHIGVAFSLTDDLADLSRDYRTGDANTILLRAGVLPPWHPVPARHQSALNRSLADSHLPAVINAIVGNLATAIQLGASTNPAVDHRRFRLVLLAYTQSWLDANGKHLTGQSP